MADTYTIIEDFRGGLDVRRSVLASTPGALSLLDNAHVTQGGDIESQKEFVEMADMPTETVGLMAVGDVLYTFGSGAEPTGIPGYVQYQRLIHPGNPSAVLTEIISSDLFRGLPYVVARFDDKSVIHFYGGQYVAGITAIQAVVTGNSSVIQRLADQINATTATTHLVADTTGGVLTIDRDDMGTFKAATLLHVRKEVPTGAAITITSSTGTPPDYTEIVVTVSGAFDDSADYNLYLETTTFQQWFQTNGLLTIYPTVVKTHRSKLYTTMGLNVYFSAIGNPQGWYVNGSGPAGAGFMEPGIQDSLLGGVNTLANYQGRLAIFMNDAIQIWNAGPDEDTQLAILQIINSAGCEIPRGVLEVGGSDTLFIDRPGIRSLRIRSQTDAAFVEDIGSPIDVLIQEQTRTMDPDVRRRAIAIMEPMEGRLWFIFDNKAYVLSYYPKQKISAWSRYNLPFNCRYAVSRGGRLWFRGNSKLYVYGGLDGITYPEVGSMASVVRLPFMHFGKPGHIKSEMSINMSMSGEWEGKVLIDPSDPSKFVDIGTINRYTYPGGRINVPVYGATHVGLELTCYGGQNTLSQVSFHYQPTMSK